MNQPLKIPTYTPSTGTLPGLKMRSVSTIHCLSFRTISLPFF